VFREKRAYIKSPCGGGRGKGEISRRGMMTIFL
jgi:hypothetical protein